MNVISAGSRPDLSAAIPAEIGPVPISGNGQGWKLLERKLARFPWQSEG